MNVLVIGGGGREHALVWKLSQSKRVTKLFCAPGNAGIARQAECVPLAATDIEQLAKFAAKQKIDFTVVGPEGPLCDGIVDVFEAKGLRIFGPNKRAAQLEGSKVFCKQVLQKAGVPTGRAEVFDSAPKARAYVHKCGAPIVVKADGLAAGKGVVVAESVAEAEQAIGDMMERKIFGEAGQRILLEECLRGEEASLMALVDGKTFRVLASAQDHKRVYDADAGPNTGGMGAYSPTPSVTKKHAAAIQRIFEGTIAALQAQGIAYRGVLYAGLMLTAEGPKVIEFNARFGDPETQVVVPRLEGDLLETLEATAAGRLDEVTLRWKRDAAVCVVLAAGGYPGSYQRGQPISGLPEAEALEGVSVFHAGTRATNGKIVTDGGRVLGVTALGANIAAAVERVYAAVGRIRFDGAHYRRDIAARALGRRK